MRPAGSLILGYGNPARGDDGLGPALVEHLSSLGMDGVETRCDYQLCVEDAMGLGDFSRVVFVDASLNGPAPFDYSALPVTAVKHLDTHTVSPGALMFLARNLFGASTEAFVMAIRGYQFVPFTETLSRPAERNLEYAARHLIEVLKTKQAA